MPTIGGGDDFVWIGGPDEGLWLLVVIGDQAIDGGLDDAKAMGIPTRTNALVCVPAAEPDRLLAQRGAQFPPELAYWVGLEDAARPSGELRPCAIFST
jgi:hypothetical protein